MTCQETQLNNQIPTNQVITIPEPTIEINLATLLEHGDTPAAIIIAIAVLITSLRGLITRGV
ncbi:MAG: hypothetical protein WA865_19155 [Spirulinaceae cyanobacterium]